MKKKTFWGNKSWLLPDWVCLNFDTLHLWALIFLSINNEVAEIHDLQVTLKLCNYTRFGVLYGV